MIARKVYIALQEIFPGSTDKHIASIIGVEASVFNKMKTGYGTGLQAAEWAMNHDSKYQALYDEVYAAAMKERNVKARARGKKKTANFNKTRGVDLKALPLTMQQFCGYVGK